MNSRLRWIILGIGLTFLIVSVVLFRSFLYQYVIMPTALILWAILRVFMTVAQEFYWVGLVFIAFVFGLRLLPMKAPAPVRPAGYDSRPPSKRLEYWQSLIEKSRESTEGRQILRRNLQDLLIQVMAIEDQVDPNSVRDDLQRRRGNVPKEIIHYLSETESGRNDQLMPKPDWIGSLLSRSDFMNKPSGSPQPGIEAVLDFLESYAEIEYDDEHHGKN